MDYSIKVGCQKVSFKEVEVIAAKLCDDGDIKCACLAS